jgi:hypothetical protein
MAQQLVHTLEGIGSLRAHKITLRDVAYTLRVSDDGTGEGTIYADFLQLPPLKDGEAVLHLEDGQIVVIHLHLICLNEERADFTFGRVALQ